MEVYKHTEQNPPKTEACVQVLKTTNQPDSETVMHSDVQEPNNFRTVPSQTAQGQKQTAAAHSHEVSRNHPPQYGKQAKSAC